MAYLDGLLTEELLIQVGDGATPTEVFAHPCLVNTERSVALTAETKAVQIPNCTEPSAPKKTVRRVVATDSQISGSGLLPHASSKTYADWLLSGLPKNIKVKLAKTGALMLSGSYLLTNFTVTGSDQGDNVTCQITLEQADAPTTSAVA